MAELPLRVLIVEDSEDDTTLVTRELRHGGYHPEMERVEDEPSLREALLRESWDVIICDYVIPGYGGLAALKLVQDLGVDTPFILISGKIGEDTAVECMKAGAHDYIMKNNMPRMVPAIRRELVESQVRRERARAMAETINARREWELTFDAVPDLIALLDPECRIIRVNQALAQCLGRTKEELVGEQCFACMHRADRPPVSCPHLAMVRERSEQVVEIREEMLQGDFILSVTPIYDDTGNLVSVVHVARDITRRKKSELQLKSSLAEKEVLLSELHHRVKNNMQFISSLLSIQSRNVEDPVSRKTFRECQDRIKAMALIHDQLYRKENLARVPFGEYLKGLIDHISISYAVAPQLVEILLEERDEFFFGVDIAIPCGLIMNELITNAIMHGLSEGQGTITVVVAAGTGGRAILSVTNDGASLPAGFSLERDGSMGLWLVGTLASQIGGDLEVTEDSAGTTFRVQFSPQEEQRLE